MCGICGFTFEDKKLLKSMTDLLTHRGPDEQGTFNDKNISLGHRRLSIIDLKTGQQPMANEDETVWIVFNGEIYNYTDLKVELEKKGHTFRTNSDTETIIHGYEEYGVDIVKHLNGCFAFAIWDTPQKKLFIARDRLGIKPLYYTVVKNQIIFASEIKALLSYSQIKRSVNKNALSHFLSFRCNPTEETMFKNIFKLPPGNFLEFEKGNLKKQSYWHLSFNPTKKQVSTNSKQLLEKLKKSVKMRLMSDVPLGAYISGGIDSATITALMSEETDTPVKTFSVGFEGNKEYNELTYARKIADYFETDHKEIIVQPETSTLLPKIVWHNDEPMSDPTCIPTYLLSEQTKKKCTVVLTGEGADEDLGGYFQYKMMNAYDKIIRKLPRSFRSQVISPAIQQAPPGILNKFFKYASELGPEGLKRFDKYLKATTQESAYLAMVSIFDDDELKDILKNPSVSIEQYTKPYFSNKDPLVNAMGFENQTLLPENLLMKVDKMTMAFGVEARVPFLDHNVAEFCSTISSNQKIRRWKEKFILRKSMKKLIPELARKRKKERFFVPINLWFQGELKEITQQLLDPKIIAKQGFFKEEYVTKALSGLETSSLFYSRQLWSLLNFQLWHNQFIENDNLKKPTQI